MIGENIMIEILDIFFVLIIGTIISVIIHKGANIKLSSLAIPVLTIVFVIYMTIKFFA